jgi:DNA polymerase-4
MPGATARTEAILVTARGLLADARPTIERQGLTLLGISVANLENEDAVQLTLPFDRDWSSALDSALDEVRSRFGTAAVTRAVLLGRDPGFTVPLLPD